MNDDFNDERRRMSFWLDVIYTVIVIAVMSFFRFGLWATLIGLTLVVLAIIFIRYVLISKFVQFSQYLDRRRDRLVALSQCKIFLKPYDSIWKNLELYNSRCSVKLGYDEISISFIEKQPPYRKARVVKSNIHSYYDAWNMFCLNFEIDTTYQSLIDFSNICKFSVIETAKVSETIEAQTTQEVLHKNLEKDFIKSSSILKVDINNCSESEIAKLPYINVILAKKIIKRRNEKQGFKSFEEFSKFIKLNSEAILKLEGMVEIKPIENGPKIIKYKERRVDL